VTLLHFQLLAAFLFCIGLYGVLARRSSVLVLMAIELMLNAVNVYVIAVTAFGKGSVATGQVIAIFVITVAAAEIGLALAIVMRLYRAKDTVNIDEITEMKG
tara:strand:- start:4474 stop:4779 length:306 start_codon:yes stop_codon:yes gene_type:complete